MNKTDLFKTAALALTMVASTGVLADDAGSAPAGTNSGGMPMMQHMQGGMPMMQQQPGGGMPMMGGPGGMMNPQMMQQMMAMRQQHMQTMETHLANIEALLKELVALQKAK